MSNEIFPDLPGLDWGVRKTPIFSTKTLTSASQREQRASYSSYPLWRYALQYEFLRSGSRAELQTLWGFFLRHFGQLKSFLYRDPEDHAVTGQQLGLGNGARTTFALVRSFGGFIEPVTDVDGLPVVKVNGLVQAAGWSVDAAAQVVFAAPPAPGAVVTADFSFYRRCRFLTDELEASAFAHQFWEAQQVEFRSVKE